MSARQIFTPGIRHMLVAVLSFSTMNLLVKLMPAIPPMELVFFRCLVSLLICLYLLHKAGVHWLGENRLMLALRGICGTMALFLFFITIKKIPFAGAVTLAYTSPVFSAMLGVLFLKEKLKPVQWVYISISLLGVAVLKGFDPRIPMLYFFLGIGSAMFSALAYMLVRRLKGREHPVVVVLHFQLVGTLAGAVGTAVQFQMPQGWDWIMLLGMGLLTQLGQLQLTKALQIEQLGIATSLNFLGVLYAVFFGVLFFQEHLTPGNILGMILVAAGVVANVVTGKRAEVIATTNVVKPYN
ncbi:MAG TPA: DMT family transporter [Saprospiraceae bacterium]|nr:DMT family transporter [Saprospiraceae bacterium]HRK81149.1 DMT family transporter [Saprospiraceae bacterium]